MSPSLKLVSSAARSPGFSMAGPEVTRRLTPISFATIPARVVLPNPGGPYSSTWSSASPRIFADCIKIDRFSFAFSWPIYSERVFGLREVSTSESSIEVYSGAIIRFSKSISFSSISVSPSHFYPKNQNTKSPSVYLEPASFFSPVLIRS